MKEKLDAAQSVKELKEVLMKKIRKKHPKYLSKIGYWNMKTEGEAQVTALVNRVTREFSASSLEEVIPCDSVDCDKCGKAGVIKSRLIALGVVAAATNQGAKNNPVIENMLKGYLNKEDEGEQF